MTGTEFSTAVEEINGGDPIASTLRFQFGNLGKNLIEQRRPWMILRKTDTSETVTAASTWQTSIDLSTITDFSRFYQTPSDPYPIRLFDGTNKIAKYRLVPFEQRLEYKDSPNTAVYDHVNKLLYLNGTVPHAGTLYIRYIRTTSDFTTNSDPIWVFPLWSHMLLPLFAVGIHKGGVDYDDINARMAPDNRALAELTVKQLESWDNELQLLEQEGYEPYERSDGWRPDHINL
jgi:hypothetical protein